MATAKFGKSSLQGSERTRRHQLSAARQDQPRSTEKLRTIVPPPQSTRIMQRYIGGESIRQIAREEHRDRATVTKIVRSDEMQTFVHQMRERYYGLGFDALDAVQHSPGHSLGASDPAIPTVLQQPRAEQAESDCI